MAKNVENITGLFKGKSDIVLNLKADQISLAIMENGEVKSCVDLPFGSQDILDHKEKKEDSYIFIQDHIKILPEEYKQKVSNNKWLFIVGDAAWQIVKSHKKQQIQNGKTPDNRHIIDIDEFNKIANYIESKSEDKIIKKYGISKFRVGQASAAAVILSHISYQFNITAVVALHNELRRDIVAKMDEAPKLDLTY